MFVAVRSTVLSKRRMKKFADRLGHRIATLGISRPEAARRCHIEPRTFGYYFDPKRYSEPDYLTLLRICEALRTHPNYLLGVTDNPEREEDRTDIRRIESEVKRLALLIDKRQDKS
jgi:hypothetical protein